MIFLIAVDPITAFAALVIGATAGAVAKRIKRGNSNEQ